jgi:predicted ATPase with chaperone activity
MDAKMIRKHGAITADGERLLENAVSRWGAFRAGITAFLQVSRTIADLHACESVEAKRLSATR